MDWLNQCYKKVHKVIRDQLYLDQLENTSLSAESAVWKMVKDNKLRTIKDLLLNDKVHVDQVIFSSTGHTLLHEAVVLNRYEIFILALHYSPNLEKQDKSGATALIKAVSLGRMSMVKKLVEQGADINYKVESQNQNSLDKARLHEHWEIADYLEKQLQQKQQQQQQQQQQQ